mmetsp:Transcript_1643/g.6341  ORF Transcript_1643/g.6341 Transcript_1643/m.6341 type:complete len:224 (-) Transcript_1643:831-1502(-)
MRDGRFPPHDAKPEPPGRAPVQPLAGNNRAPRRGASPESKAAALTADDDGLAPPDDRRAGPFAPPPPPPGADARIDAALAARGTTQRPITSRLCCCTVVTKEVREEECTAWPRRLEPCCRRPAVWCTKNARRCQRARFQDVGIVGRALLADAVGALARRGLRSHVVRAREAVLGRRRRRARDARRRARRVRAARRAGRRVVAPLPAQPRPPVAPTRRRGRLCG